MSGVIFMEGFDSYNGTQTNIGLQTRWSPTNWWTAPVLTTGRFGGQCMSFNEDRFGDGCESRVYVGSAIGPAFTVAHAFRCSSVSAIPADSAYGMIQLLSGTNPQLSWRPNPDGSISIYRNGNGGTGTKLYTTAPNIIQTNVWHWIDFSGTINTTTGTVIFKVDGITVANLTAQNTQNYVTLASFDTISVNASNTMRNTVTGYIDDLYVLDSATTLGERRIETIRPSADPVSKTWSPDTGTVEFSRINDTTVNTASYIQASTVGNLDLFDTVDLSGSPPNIDAVMITAYATKSDAGTRNIGLVGDVGGTQLQSPDIGLTASYFRYNYLMVNKPGGGSWDTASVNSLKIGPKVTL